MHIGHSQPASDTAGYVEVAVAVVRRAKQDAEKGDRGARAWLEQLRADVAAEAPAWLRRRVEATAAD
jgi:hypothetical protein